MDENHRQLIKDNINKLVENCNADNIIEFLKCRNIFTEREVQIYASASFNKKPEEERCRQIFTNIQTRGPNAFSTLLECLKATNHVTQFRLLQINKVAVSSYNETPISVRKSTSFPQNQDVYRMKSYPKGYFIFINNLQFENLDPRNGAEMDEEFLYCLKETGFHSFNGRDIYKNKTVQEMWGLLTAFASKDNLAEVDSCIVMISSHGNIHDTHKKLYIHGTDNVTSRRHLFCDDIIELFDSEECKLRKGCPKIFIFQACRGKSSISHGAIFGSKSVHLKQRHEEWTDTFLLAPSMEGFECNRDPILGSWLFIALKKVFCEHAHNRDIDEMKDLVNKYFDELAEETNNEYQQTLSLYKYGVDKKLYFSPGLFGDSEDIH